MRARIFKLDAFTTRRFRGNPAAVVLLPSFPDESLMQAVAAENTLPETAFLVPENSDYRLRWFTPATEVPLCGHATLASAAVVMERLEADRKHVVFGSASGPLPVNKTAAGYAMDFPARFSDRVSSPPILAEAIGAVPVEVCANDFNYLAVLESEDVVRAIVPDMALISRLDRSGLIVTVRQATDTISSVVTLPRRKVSRKIRLLAARIACWPPTGRSSSVKPSFELSKRQRAAAKCSAASVGIGSNWKATVFFIWKGK